MRRWASILVAAAGGMGFSGVALAAASVHSGGGDLARTASQFLLVHAVAVIGLASAANGARLPLLYLVAATVMALGTAVFSGDLAALAFLNTRPFIGAAPLGGAGLIAGWGLVVIAGLRTCLADLGKAGR